MVPSSPPSSTSNAGPPSGLTAQAVRILDSYLAELEKGNQTTPDELLARHPDLAAALRPYLTQLTLLHRVTEGLRDPKAPPSGLDGPRSRLLGDFRLLREVGRGGMGIVYEAEQLSLNRRVALKVLPFAATLDDRQLRRFRNEAQTAAGLHHPHIVPVHAVGEEQGVHYYAMQFIDGQNLAAVLARARGGSPSPGKAPPDARTDDTHNLAETGASVPPPGDAPAPVLDPHAPGYFRAVARLGVQAAEALEHAHREGVLHRDVKPGNLLLEPTGHLWVTDFGLARFRSDSGLTLTGDLVGTLRYMSPEQAVGKQAVWDCRGDVYSLGVTLYEMLTLRPAFDAPDRHLLLQQIASQEPLPPRRVNRAVPRDLETIVLTAMAKDPADRYPSARALAEDLERFLQDRPILARRPALLERASRWARRHRPVVAAALVMLLLSAIALAVSTWLVWGEQERTAAAYRAEAEQRRHAETNWRLAREAVDDMYTRVAERLLYGEPQMDDVQREFLEKALAFYERFAHDNRHDPAFRRDAALAHRRVGDIHRRLGRHEEALAAYANAIAAFEALAGPFPSRPEAILDLTRAVNNRAVVLKRQGSFAEAEAAYRRSIDLRARLDPAEPEYLRVQAEAHHNLGMLLADRDREEEAEAAYRQALDRYQKLAAHPRAPLQDRAALANSYHVLGMLLRETGGRRGEGAKALRAGLEVQEKVHAAEPHNADYRLTLATLCNDLGNLLEGVRRHEEAEPLLRRGMELLERLSAEFPRRPNYRANLATSQASLGWLLRQTDRFDDAEALYRKALVLRTRLVEENPKAAEYQSGLGALLNNLGELLRRRDRLEEAQQAVERAIEHQLKALAVNPKNPTYRHHLQVHYGNLAKTLTRLGDHDGALRAAAEPVRRDPEEWSRYLRGAFVVIGLLPQAEKDSRLEEGRRGEVAKSYSDKARELLVGAARKSVGKPKAQDVVAWFLMHISDERFRDPGLALQLARAAVEAAPKNATHRHTLAVALYRTDDFKGALAAFEEARGLGAERLRCGGFLPAILHFRLGNAQKARACYDEASQALEKARGRDPRVQRFRQEAAQLLGISDAPQAAAPADRR